MIQLISLVMLAYSYFLIQTNLPSLPARMPTHFNAAGVADGWGSPDVLWFLLGTQALTCAVFLLIPFLGQRFPGAVHFGSRRLNDFPPAQRAQVLPLLNEMSGYLSVVMNLFFVLMLDEMIQAATQPIPHLHPIFPLALLFGGMTGITVFYLWKVNRIVKGEDEGATGNK